MSLVSKRFYSLVTTPHAWRIAFSRFFPGQDATDEDYASRNNRRGSDQQERDSIRAEQRFFTRLTALASWRSEYIIRTRLLRSLGRGKPQAGSAAKGSSGRANSSNNNSNAAVTYNSQLSATVNHIHAVWNDGKKTPRFIHGTDEAGHVSASDPGTGKVDNWNATDLQMHPQFVDVYPGAEQYGLGEGSVVGVPNVMDVSQPFGMVYGEGFPGGCAYYRHPEEKRGRVLAPTVEYEEHPLDLPKVPTVLESITSVCIAKSAAIPNLTSGMVGILTGSSCGIVTGYSAGLDKLEGHRLTRGEVTCRWVLSPGVPIIALCIDDQYNDKRNSFGRIWAVALNALGEVFYLDGIIDRPVQKGVKDTAELDALSWETGRSVEWKLVEPTRRLAKEDPYQEPDFNGSYTPRSSPGFANLTKKEIRAENRSIESFLKHRPEYFRKNCQNWDMRRKLEVDFAGDDGYGVGENIIVVRCGNGGEDAGPVKIERFSRTKSVQTLYGDYSDPPTPSTIAPPPVFSSIFGGASPEVVETPSPTPPVVSMGQSQLNGNAKLVEEWKKTIFAWTGGAASEITTTAMDTSNYALLTAFEDPIMAANGGSRTSSSATSPSLAGYEEGHSLNDVPGYRARFIALGTNDGTIVLYNIRGGQPSNRPVPDLQPVRVIATDSPQISCLALSALYLVHGGNDGLVQAWDVLASTTQPIRTLNSRFSSRARRRLVQAEASAQGVGINLFAAGAIALDSDPTLLRGIVSLGTHLRYWAYSSSAADEASSKKRRLRRSSVRGQNGAADRYTNSGRGAIMDYIVNEQHELQAEKRRREAEKEHLHGRFGVGLAGLSEEEAVAYALLVSEEAAQKEQERMFVEASANASPAPDAFWTSPTASTAVSRTPSPSRASASSAPTPRLKTEDELEDDIEEAIRLSLLEASGGAAESSFDLNYTAPPGTSGSFDVPFVVKSKKNRRSKSTSPSASQAGGSPNRMGPKGKGKGKEKAVELDDLDYALQLSLAEEESRRAAERERHNGYRY